MNLQTNAPANIAPENLGEEKAGREAGDWKVGGKVPSHIMCLPCAYQNRRLRGGKTHLGITRNRQRQWGGTGRGKIESHLYEQAGMKWGEDTELRCWFEWEMTGTVAEHQPQIGRMANEHLEKRIHHPMSVRSGKLWWVTAHHTLFDSQRGKSMLIATWRWSVVMDYTWHRLLLASDVTHHTCFFFLPFPSRLRRLHWVEVTGLSKVRECHLWTWTWR